ncbi:LysR family transcriptional regulator [Legionella cincinnatiensis]|uniref:Transcriptional regulator n=1 Tax=Legionella cincinnatiensis TaxID=28085 RepID=A0A378IJP9_9GAMM|nr:LysR family transcriptional regulator [Legionella cincinnatiensis]KTC83403.1 LysR family transporter transcriptional regulator [Legionella cincinnatiensis]STX35488.1 transcriptional regulator [Legionella cincinnatiensis]
MDIRKINLNLLLHLSTLLTERSVSKAAEKSCISQTAMSHILRQLRDLFDDPLFIRRPQGLQPTQKALKLEPKINEFLNTSNSIFQEDIFEPQSEKFLFKTALAGHGEYMILPRLCAYLAKNAPNFSLHVSSVSEYFSLEHLLANELDFVIAPGFIETGPTINKELLLEEEAACIMNKAHPLANRELTQDMYLESEQIDIKVSYLEGDNILYKALHQYRHRNIKITVSNIISAMEIVKYIDLIATVPMKLAVFLQDRYQFIIKPFPFPNKEFSIYFFYHMRLTNYKPLQWMIEIIKSLLQKPNCFT